MLDNFFNLILGWTLTLGNLYSVIVLSFLITLLITVIYKYTSNQREMREIRDKQKQYQREMKELRDNPQEMMKKQKETMKLTGSYFKHSMKPMLYTFLPIILIFGWMRNQFVIEGVSVKMLNLGIVNFGWLGTYIIFSIIFSTLIRKILKVY